tara:strand:+ start:640 stop:2259 length:1620 start_codon:yes stop_codon:yes gene_type:complete
MNSYIANMPRKGLSKFLEEDERRKEEERFTDEVNFSTETRVNTDKGYKEEFDRDQTFLQKTGDFVKQVLSIPDRLDKAVGIYDTRQSAIKTITGGLSEDHLVAALAGEMLVPDTIDLITLGLGYIPRRVLLKGPKAIKMFLKFKKSKLPKAAKGSQALPDLGNAGKLASDADYDAMAKAVAKRAGIEGKNVDDALSEAGLVNRVDTNPSDFSKVTSPEYEDIVLKGMERMGMKDGVFDLDLYNQNSGILTEMSDTLGGAIMKSGQRRAKKLGKRNWMEYFLSPQTLKGNFEVLRKEGKIAAGIEWEDFLKSKGLTVQDIQVHHINPLYDSIHLFDGVKWGSNEYWEIISTLISMGARPGIVQRGDDITNVIRTLGKSTLTDTPHGIAHAYYKDIVPEFFSAAERLNMKLEPGYRITKTKEWAKIVNQSEDIVVKAHKAWEALNPKSRMPFDELIDQMGAYDNKGILKGISLKYQVKDIQELVKQINFESVIEPLPNIKFPNVSETKQRMLMYKAQPGVTWKMVKKKFPGFNYEQLDLFN